MRPPPTPLRRPGVPLVVWLIAASGILLFVGVFGAVTGLFALGRAQPVEAAVPATLSAVEPPPARLGASWYTQVDVLPTLVDIDGDGTKDIVGLFWRSGHDEVPLYVAAVDGKDFALKWSAGPYASQWNSTRTHLAVVGAKVVVTDSQETLRVLDLHTGLEAAVTETLEGGVTELCAVGDGTPRAIVRGVATPGTGDGSRLYDVDRRAFEPLPAGMTCPRRYDTCSPSAKGGPSCFTYGAVPHAPKGATTSPSLYVTKTLRAGALAIAIGSDPKAPANGRAVPYAVGFSTNASVATWRQSLVLDGDQIHFGGAKTELRDNTFVTFYPTKAGPYRLVGRDPASGALQWSALVPGSHEGSYAAAFGVEGDRVLVVMNQTLHVFDAATGQHLAGLDASTL